MFIFIIDLDQSEQDGVVLGLLSSLSCLTEIQ